MTGWLLHARGIARLIERRGPLRPQSLYERHLLEINRLIICLSFLLRRERCFLEQPDWITNPWALDPASKTPILLHLQDIFCSMPGFVEDATNLKLPNIPPGRFKLRRESISERILYHLHSIYEWRAQWEKDDPNASYELVPADEISATFGIGIDPVFPCVIYFSQLTCAHEITLYNAMMLLLLQLGTEVIGPTFSPTTTTLPPRPPILTNLALLYPGEAHTTAEIANEICKSIHYHLLDEHSSAGPFYLLFPLRAAYQAFGPSSREASWLQAMMRHIANLSGFEISRKLSAQKPMRYTAVKTAYAELT